MKPHGRAITDTWVTAQILGQKVGAKLHKLAALRILSEGIAKFEDIGERRTIAKALPKAGRERIPLEVLRGPRLTSTMGNRAPSKSLLQIGRSRHNHLPGA